MLSLDAVTVGAVISGGLACLSIERTPCRPKNRTAATKAMLTRDDFVEATSSRVLRDGVGILASR